jgi:hypothetical protein
MKAPPDLNIFLAGFFKRLEGVQRIIRVVTGSARVDALIMLRGLPERRILLAFSRDPFGVDSDSREKGAPVMMDIEGAVLHEVLTGRKSAAVALGRREMLIRGSPSDFARVIPLFWFGPALYRSHLRSFADVNGKEDGMKPVALVRYSVFERLCSAVMCGAAFATGWALGFVRRRVMKRLDLFSVLDSLRAGLERADPSGRDGERV